MSASATVELTSCTAIIERIDGGVLTIRYIDGMARPDINNKQVTAKGAAPEWEVGEVIKVTFTLRRGKFGETYTVPSFHKI